jgi:hypothetical protein
MANGSHPHKVAVVYPDYRSAAAALRTLSTAKLDDIMVTELTPDASDLDQTTGLRTGMARNTEPGETATATVSMRAAKIMTLFVSAPVVASLFVLGYGAIIGRTAESIRRLRLSENIIAGLVKDTLSAGYYVLILHAENDEARRNAEAVISATLPDQCDTPEVNTNVIKFVRK